MKLLMQYIQSLQELQPAIALSSELAEAVLAEPLPVPHAKNGVSPRLIQALLDHALTAQGKETHVHFL